MIIDTSNLELIYDSQLPVDPPKQTYDHTRIVKFREDCLTKNLRGRKLRTRIHHDSSYPHQCWYRVDTWTDSGWQEVVLLDTGDAPQTQLTSGYSMKTEWRREAQQDVEELIEFLQGIAAEVLA